MTVMIAKVKEAIISKQRWLKTGVVHALMYAAA